MAFVKGEVVKTMHIFVLHNLVHGRKLLGLDTYVVFIDFRKEFDTINRQLLWDKFQLEFGIKGPFLELLKGLYTQVTSCVKINEEVSDWFQIDSGVTQGCIIIVTLTFLNVHQ